MINKKIRVLQFTTFNEDCGIGKYQENVIEAFDGELVESQYYDLSPNVIKHLDKPSMKRELEKITSKAREFDVIHVQHEFGFFKNAGSGFADIMSALKRSGRPVVVTIHTAPELILKKNILHGKSPRNIAGFLKRTLQNRRVMKLKLMPFRQADTIITFNSFTKEQLIHTVGVTEDKIKKMILPVKMHTPKNPSEYRKRLGFGEKDIVLCTVGFVNENKGVDHAIKALRFLPEKYKLAILGGINPDSGNPSVLNSLSDLIIQLGLEDRVRITGYIDDDSELLNYIGACDKALYPYSPDYYRLASSDAINKALGVKVQVIAYPTASFAEINSDTPGTIALTKTATYYELARMAQEPIEADSENFSRKNSYARSAEEITVLYRALTSN